MTPRHVTFAPNSTDTAVLISPPGRQGHPAWAFVSRGSAAAAIDNESRCRRARNRGVVLRGLALVVTATILLAVFSVLHGLGYDIPLFLPTGVLGGFAFLLYIVIVEESDERVSPDDDVQRKIARFLARRDGLTVCSVALAHQMSAAQHHSLTIADTYGLMDEVLELLQEQLETRQREEEQRAEQSRRAQALAIVDEHSSSRMTYPDIS